jgi:hypothetical protein
MLMLCLVLAAGEALAQTGNYRVEVLVFHHVYSDAKPLEVDTVRPFHDLFELDRPGAPETPVRLETSGGTFDNIRRRLQRLDAYQPLALMIFEQNRIDYHPPVRLHNDEVIAEELHFPGDVIYIDLREEDMLLPYVSALYRLDGFVQLRRSRFLHIDLDLEYRIDDPAWAEAFPPLEQTDSGADGGDFFSEPVSAEEPPDTGPTRRDQNRSVDMFSNADVLYEEPPEPFRIHRLNQSRQIRTDTIQYFDSAFLGVLVRVTATQATTGDE